MSTCMASCFHYHWPAILCRLIVIILLQVWFDWLFEGVYFPPLSIFFVGINKCIRKSLPQLYVRWKFCMIHVLLTWELFWQHNDAITFFIFICISRYLEFFFQKSLLEACTSLSWVDYGKIWTNAMRVSWKYFEMLRV